MQDEPTTNQQKLAKRIALIVVNLFCYGLVIYYGMFVIENGSGLREINEFGKWMFMLVCLLLASLYGTFRIVTWIREEKI
ncbi:hypothetical protein [uncultured Brevibacillus sp.]|uniref:hypothetical protein n=1 Tax=uncultured Brevibacillus sp. TaxID=169970 RepID=UPI002597EEA4|nr:hypothetical protein [uncultured Brevibacillus sp.]